MPYGPDHVQSVGEQASSVQNLFSPAYTHEQCVGNNQKVELETMRNFKEIGLGNPLPGPLGLRTSDIAF